MYGGALYTYQHSFLEWLHLEDTGVFVAAGDENKSPELLERLRAAGAALADPDDHNAPRLVIRAGDVVVRAPLNQTQAARDLMNRLPLTVSGSDSGVDYCCELKEGTFDEADGRAVTDAIRRAVGAAKEIMLHGTMSAANLYNSTVFNPEAR